MNCPCNSSLKYHACCGKFHLGTLFPSTAEALSRARYSAYTLNKPHFIYNTWDKSMRPSFEEVNLLMSQHKTHTNYNIIHKDMGLEHDDIGMVTFTASASAINSEELTELGMYKRLKGKWKFYRTGDNQGELHQ